MTLHSHGVLLVRVLYHDVTKHYQFREGLLLLILMNWNDKLKRSSSKLF